EDEPIGVALLTDLLRSARSDDDPVTAMMRDPLIVPERMSLPDVLEELIQQRAELACVIDEFGTFSGIVTEEDLAEELIGQMYDEHDEENTDVTAQPEAENTWEMVGDLHADELERLIGHGLPAGDFETVAGLVIAELGELPEDGRSVTVALPEAPSDLVADT